MLYGSCSGCSTPHSVAPFEKAAREVASALGLALEEIEEWSCQGAAECVPLDRIAAYVLVGRTLAIAGRQFRGRADAGGAPTLVASCGACFASLAKANHDLGTHAAMREAVDEALAEGGLHFDPGSVTVRHLLDVVHGDAGLAAVRSRVTRPLSGLRVAPYYGCLPRRPPVPGSAEDDAEDPTHLDELVAALGAEVAGFPLKTHCCGGRLSQVSAETASSLLHRLLRAASDTGADVIVAACPMCQENLGSRQDEVNARFGTGFGIPVLHFTQLMGLAFGIDAEALGLGPGALPARARSTRRSSRGSSGARGTSRSGSPRPGPP